MTPLRIGTRGSQLALWQARAVKARVEETGGPTCELVVIRTSGDRLAEAALAAAGGKRLFVKEIEDALLGGDVDLAVHSAKDLPADLPAGLAIGAVLAREDPRDALVLPAGRHGGGTLEGVLASLGPTPRVGTSSVRRVALLRHLMPAADFHAMRGNLDTRLRKLDAGQADLLVLAMAGLRRLGFAHRISAAVPIDACVPAPGQGTLAVEIRADDAATGEVVARVNDARSAAALAAERALVTALGGGCQLPLGALALPVDDGPGQLVLEAIVASLDGVRIVRRRGQGSLARPEELGQRVATELVAGGAAAILEEVRSERTPRA